MIDFNKPVQTRSGSPVRILCTDAKMDWPIVGLVELTNDDEIVLIWDNYGQSPSSYSYNLIQAPVINPNDIPWEHLIDEIQWVAMDRDGSWNGYSEKPIVDFHEWAIYDRDGVRYFHIKIRGVKMPNVPKDQWKETLVRRPSKDCDD